MRTAALPTDIAAAADETRTMIARNFSDLLKKQRWSKRAAASELGLTHTYVTSRANGAVEMSGSDIALFAGFLGVDVKAFFESAPKASATISDIADAKGTKRPLSDYSGGFVAPIVHLFGAAPGVVNQ